LTTDPALKCQVKLQKPFIRKQIIELLFSNPIIAHTSTKENKSRGGIGGKNFECDV